ncbi:Shikimate kinase [Candidatus Desulforudis audaxviator MP104C]|uniref:Shikimate kinase n=1 Tax=Desulforudis audaxviator (strain MP104C) TaxID=477974 RepID=AROK_DESAP|nr:shikimate kinase [Candidatus Desulforudis audaxviator]B1I3D6.1 RecName: Full=Shikimate kinase; Short=SK [Candidatus Desulforudis audaxviator MP104C]ACA59501.1 Shikimate kinase [Candidatus Desulforudis audaxviator MP104C]AZK59484.1 Shikimate kinase I [Candidatus Desulforudis audaxviator]
MRNVILIGFMGTGKSAVGWRLARILDRPFLDTDSEIERLAGKPVRRIFIEDGEVRFRSEEALLCRKLAVPRGLVVATGGGVVLNPENVANLRAGGVLIGLSADPEVIYQRVRRKKSRPLLRGNVRARIRELLEERAGAYDVAEFTVDTGMHSLPKTVGLIMEFLKERGYLEAGSDSESGGVPELPDISR